MGNFVTTQFPFLVRLHEKFVIRPLRLPVKRLVRGFVVVMLVIGCLWTLAPVAIIKYVGGYHWSKGWPLLMAIQPVRSVMDIVYSVLVRKLHFVYVLLRVMVFVALFPLIMLKSLFGSFDRIRVILFLVLIPPLLAVYAAKVLGFLCSLFMLERLQRFFENMNRDPNAAGLATALVHGCLLLFAIQMKKKSPSLYAFFFDRFMPMHLFLMLLVISVYVHMTMLVHVDGIRSGRVNGGTEPKKTELVDKRRQLTIMVTSAVVISAYALISMNPGHYERGCLMDPAMCAAE